MQACPANARNELQERKEEIDDQMAIHAERAVLFKSRESILEPYYRNHSYSHCHTNVILVFLPQPT